MTSRELLGYEIFLVLLQPHVLFVGCEDEIDSIGQCDAHTRRSQLLHLGWLRSNIS